MSGVDVTLSTDTLVERTISKPAYRVPLMGDARPELPYVVVSTFSGCGGSCLGFEFAGYRVAWASEFVEKAQAAYRANHPSVPLNTQDVREVGVETLLDEAGLESGEADVLEGSPPCSSFSLSGSREKGWGKVSKYSSTSQRTDDLFFEYVRLLEGLRPKTFVAENVAGLIVGKSKGYFKEIIRRMKAAGYHVEARLLDAQWLGVPQIRGRVFFVGVRDDLYERVAGEGLPLHPSPYPYRYSFEEAVETLDETARGAHTYRELKPGKLRTLWERSDPRRVGVSGHLGDTHKRIYGRAGAFTHHRVDERMPVNTLDTSATLYHPTEPRSLSIAEAKRVSSFPDDFELSGSFINQWERLARSVPPLMMRAQARVLADVLEVIS